MHPVAQVSQTRLQAGKKIDTWKFNLPDDTKLEMDVYLHANRDEVSFSVSSSHPVFKNVTGKHTDLQILRDEITILVQRRIHEHYSADWKPAVMIEVDHSSRNQERSWCLDEERTISFSFKITPLYQNVSAPVGNRGETLIITREIPKTVIQRSHKDVFERSKSIVNLDKTFSESGKTISRTVLTEPENHEAQVAEIEMTLRRFTNLFADRMSPNGIGMRGMPTPQDLVDMMSKAADSDYEVVLSEEPEIRF